MHTIIIINDLINIVGPGANVIMSQRNSKQGFISEHASDVFSKVDYVYFNII